MRIAQVAPLYEAVPPKLYGGTERVVSLLTEELVRRGHDVTLFASGDSVTSARLVAVTERALRLDITSRELHLVVNRPVKVRLRSTGVIHSFFIPAFRVKQDTMPGQTIDIWFTPTQTGTFEVACAELCGIGHYAMRGNVVVQSQQEFDAWLAQQKPALQPAQ